MHDDLSNAELLLISATLREAAARMRLNADSHQWDDPEYDGYRRLQHEQAQEREDLARKVFGWINGRSSQAGTSL